MKNGDNKLRIRKLTPKEVYRLMGFDDEDFEKARLVNSDTQLYKQAGNSIVVNVLEAIFRNLNLQGNIKILELFAGIGACSKALERLDVEHEIVDAVEIDKYAIKSFNAIHNTNFEPQDITTWDKDIKVDLIMHGSPCQDFSLAGKQAGGDEGSGTRSSLMYETLRIVEKLRPRYVIWENVKNILSQKHKHNFDSYLEKMSELGYTNYYQVLNAKDYGIPQNRERVFTISILESNNFEFPKESKNENNIKRLFNFSARQDCRVVYDSEGISPTLVAGMGEGGGKVPMFIENENFDFPPKQELKLKLKDMLEDEVDEKYYLSSEKIAKISQWNAYQKPFEHVQGQNSISPTLTARGAGEEHAGMILFSENLKETTNLQEQCLRIKNNTKKGYLEAYEGDGVYTNTSTKRGTVQHDMIQTLTTFQDKGVVVKEERFKDLD